MADIYHTRCNMDHLRVLINIGNVRKKYVNIRTVETNTYVIIYEKGSKLVFIKNEVT